MTPLPFPPPATLDSSFVLCRPTAANIKAMSRVYYDSFVLDPGNTWWWPEDHEALSDWLYERIKGKMADRNVRHFQVVDAQRGGVVVAFARWDIPQGYESTFGPWFDGADGGNGGHGVDVSRIVAEGEDGDVGNDTKKLVTVLATPLEEVDAKAKSGPVKTISKVPQGANPELCHFFFNKLAKLSDKWKAGEMLGLSLLCTLPAYHRRGAAKALLSPMLALADAAGLRTYLEATEAGHPIYEKLGFRDVQVEEFDPKDFFNDDVKRGCKLYIMIREPQPL